MTAAEWVGSSASSESCASHCIARAALPAKDGGYAGGLRQPVARGSLDRCHTRPGLERALDYPLGQSQIGGRGVRQRRLAPAVQAAVVADRALVADLRVVDQVSDARLVQGSHDL